MAHKTIALTTELRGLHARGCKPFVRANQHEIGWSSRARKPLNRRWVEATFSYFTLLRCVGGFPRRAARDESVKRLLRWRAQGLRTARSGTRRADLFEPTQALAIGYKAKPAIAQLVKHLSSDSRCLRQPRSTAHVAAVQSSQLQIAARGFEPES